MENFILDSTMNRTEIQFRELIRMGDDFFKIELLRQAKKCYQKALLLNIETDSVKLKLEECEKLLAFENKVVLSLLTLSVVVLTFLLIF